MKIVYDQEVDVPRILFSKAAIEESDEDKPGLILDYDCDRKRYALDPSASLRVTSVSSALDSYRGV